MEEIVLKKEKSDSSPSRYTCELTEEMDTYIIPPLPFKTYMVEFETLGNKVTYVIRYPGSTKGYIVVENDVVTEVRFYDEPCFDILGTYKKEMKNIIDKYIGLKVRVE